MADHDYRWRNERFDRDDRSGRRPGGDRDFYGRDRHGEDDYGMGFGEEGVTNYRLRSPNPDVRDQGSSGRSSYGGDYDRNQYFGEGTRDWGGNSRPLSRGSYGSGSGGYGSSSYGSGSGYGSGQRGGGYTSDPLFSGPSSYGQSRSSSYGGRDSHENHRSHAGGNERGWLDRATDEVSSWFGDDDAERRRRLDARHEGRGPKGYRRSDERIREDVSDRLTDDPYVDASDIEITVSGSEVTLSGTVDSRTARRRAEDLTERLSGVTHVQNNLRVASGSEVVREERDPAKSRGGAFPKS